ncbi:TPA: hypothetical protein ACG0BA_004778 [Serratia odorifera]
MSSMDSCSHRSRRSNVEKYDPFHPTNREPHGHHRHHHRQYADESMSPETIDIAHGWPSVANFGKLLTPDGQVIISYDRSGHISIMRYGFSAVNMDLGGTSIVNLIAVNKDGNIFIGHSLDKSGDNRAFYTEIFPEQGVPSRTTFLPETDTVVAESLSGDGTWVVGTATPESGESYAFIWSRQTGMHNLGTLGGTRSAAHAISSDGNVIIGESQTSSGKTHAFRIVNRGLMEDLGALSGDFSVATVLTPTGDVILGYSTVQSGQRRTFRWTELEGMENLGTLGDPDLPENHSLPYGVSADGTTVGGVFVTSTGLNHTFRWTRQDGMVDIAPSAGLVRGTLLSADGSTFAGESSGLRGFVWNKTQGYIEDLGTLGGNFTFPAAISADGSVIIGTSEISTGEKYIFRWTRQTGMENMGGATGEHYQVTHVKTLNAGSNIKDTLLVGINRIEHTLFTHRRSEGTKTVEGYLDLEVPISVSENGMFIAGTGHRDDEDQNHLSAFRLTVGGEKIYLGALDPIYSRDSFAFAVSNDGTVVGQARDGYNRWRAFRWTEKSGMVDLGTLGGTTSIAQAISTNGLWITGISRTETGDNHAFRWSQHDGMRDLGTLSDFHTSTGLAVSDEGIVFGDTWNNYEIRSFRWTENHGMEDLGTLGGIDTEFLAMSADGHAVIGAATTAEGYSYRIFRWTETEGIIDVGIPTVYDKDSRSYHAGISSDGKVIVAKQLGSTPGHSSAVRWSQSQGVQLLGPVGQISTATSVSDDGLVVGGQRSLDARSLSKIACYWKITQISTNVDYIVLPQNHPITEDAFLKKLGATTDDGSRISTTLDPSMFWHLGKKTVVLSANGSRKTVEIEIIPDYPPLARGACGC